MKKMMITISDINGTRQYTLEELVRRFVPWVIMSLIIVIAIAFGAYKFFSLKTSDYQQANSQKVVPCSEKYVMDSLNLK